MKELSRREQALWLLIEPCSALHGTAFASPAIPLYPQALPVSLKLHTNMLSSLQPKRPGTQRASSTGGSNSPFRGLQSQQRRESATATGQAALNSARRKEDDDPMEKVEQDVEAIEFRAALEEEEAIAASMATVKK